MAKIGFKNGEFTALSLVTDPQSASNSIIRFRESGVEKWVMGNITSLDTWNLSKGGTLGTNDVIKALSTGVQIKGNNTNTAPPAGFIGQQLTATGNNASLLDTTATNITSIVLTAGIWDVTGMCIFYDVPTGGTSFRLGVVSTSATLGSGGVNTISTPTPPSALSDSGLTVLPQRVLVSTTTPYYLVAQANFTGGTCGCQGSLTATRVG